MTGVVEIFIMTAMVLATIFAGSRAHAAPEKSLTIVIRPAVDLAPSGDESNELTLAEIVDAATIPADDRVLVMRHLKSVVLTDRPNVGEERTFTQEGLESIVAEASRRLEAAGFALEWKIPRRSHVLRKSRFSREAIEGQLRDEFSAKCGGCETIIRQLDWPRLENLAVQSWRLSVRPERPRGSFSVPMELELTGGSKKTVMLTGSLEYFAQVPVATRAIQGAEKVAVADYKIERRNVTYGFDAAAEAKDFENSVAARSLSIGEPLWKSTLRREQMIRFGDPVRVQAGGDTWSVTSEGIAQGPGAIGDTVRVKVGKTQKLVSGILKEKGLVEIQ